MRNLTTSFVSATETDPLVYVIVLNYNGRTHLEYCLPSILETAYPNFRVLFVDNASSDDSIEFVSARFPQIELLQTGQNLGWAGGNNAGIRYALEKGARYVVLANNDIRVHPQWIAAAMEAFRKVPDTAFVSGTVLGEVTPAPLDDFAKACAQWQKNEYSRTAALLSGMALFVDIRLFERIGMIDEAYWAYGEESDLEIRAEAAGYVRVATNVPIWHYSSGTFSRYKLRASYLAIRNAMRVSIKHEPPLRLIKEIVRIFHVGCWPFYRGDMTNVTLARLRPSNVVFNFGLDLYCLGWNLFHLPQTLRRRREDYFLVRQERQRMGKQ